MDIKELKNKSLEKLLLHLGISTSHTRGSEIFYFSPFRSKKESVASLTVSITKNYWYDHGLGEGGDIIDFVCKYYQVDKKEACRRLAQTTLPTNSVVIGQKEKEASIEIRHVQPVQNKALIQYLEMRGISLEIAKRYVEEVYYRVKSNGKQYFALAFPNDKQGYEFRNLYYKGGTNPKYVSTIEGKTSNGINVFEGFMDFLTALEYFKTPVPNYTTIVLNTVPNLKYIEQRIRHASHVNLFLDNDVSGIKAAKRAIKLNSKAVNQAERLYPNLKDFNELFYKPK